MITLKDLMTRLSRHFGAELQEDQGVFQFRAPTSDGRSQLIGATVKRISDVELGVFFSEIGELNDDVNPWQLLEKNLELGYSKIAIMNNRLGVIAVCNLKYTAPEEAVQILQEVCMVADQLEEELYGHDIA
ncbi:MAG: hypothetical protein KC609_04860 [Myxococcales bacterium]|nr:hypothetical protein [Myxococcales bacterium]